MYNCFKKSVDFEKRCKKKNIELEQKFEEIQKKMKGINETFN